MYNVLYIIKECSTVKENRVNKQEIIIPNYKTLDIKNIVLDYNGTIAKDGILKDEVKTLLPLLSKKYTLHVITADTFGSVHKQVAAFEVTVNVLSSDVGKHSIWPPRALTLGQQKHQHLATVSVS